MFDIRHGGSLGRHETAHEFTTNRRSGETALTIVKQEITHALLAQTEGTGRRTKRCTAKIVIPY